MNVCIAPVRTFFVLIFLLAFGGTSVAFGETSSDFAISIQKYQLDETVTFPKDLVPDGSKTNNLVDATGNQLLPVAGIHYDIERVTPTSDGSGFQPVAGAEAFHTMIQTNTQGIARVIGLAQGMYRVTEKYSDRLKTVMEPVVLELPFPKQNGKEALNEVYLYPKSSVVTPKDTPTEKSPPPLDGGGTPIELQKKLPVTKLPQTSGNIGSFQALFYLSLMVGLMSFVGFLSMRKKHP